nr:MAG TPA: hypothetical protein [Caudoviricetes sp.]
MVEKFQFYVFINLINIYSMACGFSQICDFRGCLAL